MVAVLPSLEAANTRICQSQGPSTVESNTVTTTPCIPNVIASLRCNVIPDPRIRYSLSIEEQAHRLGDDSGVTIPTRIRVCTRVDLE